MTEQEIKDLGAAISEAVRPKSFWDQIKRSVLTFAAMAFGSLLTALLMGAWGDMEENSRTAKEIVLKNEKNIAEDKSQNNVKFVVLQDSIAKLQVQVQKNGEAIIGPAEPVRVEDFSKAKEEIQKTLDKALYRAGNGD